MILKCERLDYNKHLQYEFGSYVLMFQDNNFQHNNAALARGAGGIYLGFNPDSRSGHLVMDLETGELRHPLKIRTLPMTDEVIQRVHQLAQRDGVRTLTFANRRSEPIHFPDADLAGVGDDDDDSDDSDYEDTTDTDGDSESESDDE
eukprot:scaffold15548_cov93-Cylindrotheca_fusiformis.AAC.1